MKLLSKKGDLKRILMILIVGALLFGTFAVILSFAETAEEEKARLEAELVQLEAQLEQIEGGVWVNFACSVTQVLYTNYSCDNLTGYHTVCISNISYYVSSYCGLMPAEVVKIKSRIEEIKDMLKVYR